MIREMREVNCWTLKYLGKGGVGEKKKKFTGKINDV